MLLKETVMAEVSDVLLDRMGRVMKDEFNANMLGCDRGQLTEAKFLKRTPRWNEQEMRFSWSGGTRYVTELAVLLGLTDTRAVTKTRTPGMKATGGAARDAQEPLDAFQAPTFGGSSSDTSSWTNLIARRLYQAQDVPEKYVVYGDSHWADSYTRRSTTGAFEQVGQHPIEGRAACNGTCGSRRVAVSSAVGRGWTGAEAGGAHRQYSEPWHAQPYWIRESTTPGREVVLD